MIARLLLRLLKVLIYGVGGLALVILVYLGATYVGAAVPASPEPSYQAEASAVASRGPEGPDRIYLLTTLLHADFAIPVDDALRTRFAFLREGGVPLDNPDLRYLVFGWGSRAFYTQTPSLSDIRPGPTLRAVTGDASVMHVLPARDVSRLPNARAVRLPPGGYDRLLDFIEASFDGGAGAPRPGYGFGDAFFPAVGSFNIFRPCNIWAAAGLRRAGVVTGAWTPTTHSLLLGLEWHAPEALAN